MTPENAKKLLPIITAYAEGKTIQYRPEKSALIPDPEWMDLTDGPVFDRPAERYRIKPEPIVLYLNVYKSGNVVVHTDEVRAKQSVADTAIATAFRVEVPV